MRAPTLDRSVFVRPTAHRGLHDASRGIVENTAPAFEAAMHHGFGIECDLRPAHGGEPVVFHDATLGRLTEIDGSVASLEPAILKSIAFKATHARIQTFAELLEQVQGRVPLMVEIKSDGGGDRERFEQRIATLAAAYRGPITLKSFDPYIMIRMRARLPRLPLGLVSGGWRGPGWHEDEYSPMQRFALRHLVLAPRIGIAFVSYDARALPAAAPALWRRLGRPLFSWTVRSQAAEERITTSVDAVIFEGYLPKCVHGGHPHGGRAPTVQTPSTRPVQ